jgi:DNA-binding PadR family transcriptional regulator
MSIRHAILGVLKRGPMHGYQVASELERLIAGGRYNSAQIYHGLRWLNGRGFAVAESPEPGVFRDRRPFSITAAGRREFDRWLREPIAPARPLRDDAVIKLVFLCGDNPEQLIRALERLQRQHLRRLAATKVSAHDQAVGLGDESLLAELSGAALRFREQAELRWIEYCLLRVQSLLTPSDPAASATEHEPAQRSGAPSKSS